MSALFQYVINSVKNFNDQCQGIDYINMRKNLSIVVIFFSRKLFFKIKWIENDTESPLWSCLSNHWPACHSRARYRLKRPAPGQVSKSGSKRSGDLLNETFMEEYSSKNTPWDTEYLQHKDGDYLRNFLRNTSWCQAFCILYYIQHYKIQL